MWSECKLNEDARLQHFLSCLTIVLFQGKWKKHQNSKCHSTQKPEKVVFCSFLSCVPHLCLAVSSSLSCIFICFPTCLISSLLPLCICFSVFLLNYGELGTASSVGTFLLEESPLNLICTVASVIGSSNLSSSDTEHLTLRRNIQLLQWSQSVSVLICSSA